MQRQILPSMSLRMNSFQLQKSSLMILLLEASSLFNSLKQFKSHTLTSPPSCPQTRYLLSFDIEIDVTCPYFLCYAAPKSLQPFTPTSNTATFPIEVPTARNRVPVAVMTVGIPTPFFSGLQKRAVTFLRTIQVILLTSFSAGIGKSLSLLSLAITLLSFYPSLCSVSLLLLLLSSSFPLAFLDSLSFLSDSLDITMGYQFSYGSSSSSSSNISQQSSTFGLMSSSSQSGYRRMSSRVKEASAEREEQSSGSFNI